MWSTPSASVLCDCFKYNKWRRQCGKHAHRDQQAPLVEILLRDLRWQLQYYLYYPGYRIQIIDPNFDFFIIINLSFIYLKETNLIVVKTSSTTLFCVLIAIRIYYIVWISLGCNCNLLSLCLFSAAIYKLYIIRPFTYKLHLINWLIYSLFHFYFQ